MAVDVSKVKNVTLFVRFIVSSRSGKVDIKAHDLINFISGGMSPLSRDVSWQQEKEILFSYSGVPFRAHLSVTWFDPDISYDLNDVNQLSGTASSINSGIERFRKNLLALATERKSDLDGIASKRAQVNQMQEKLSRLQKDLIQAEKALDPQAFRTKLKSAVS